jgi:hypothetical protein
MHLCDDHNEIFVNGFKLRGLWHLKSATEEDAAKVVAALNGAPGSEKSDITDPYLLGQFLLLQFALDMGGLYLLLPREDGSDYCPVCEYASHVKDADSAMLLNSVCDEVHQSFLDAGLVERGTMQ